MKKRLGIMGVLIAGIILVCIVFSVLTPWMDQWGTTRSERMMRLPGDDLLDAPVFVTNRTITIETTPENIYPWLVQMGADKAGLYSYAWFDNLVGCKTASEITLHAEWQTLKEGDEIKICAGDHAPSAYKVVKMIPEEALVLGQSDGGKWVEIRQFVLLPQVGGSTRLISRTLTTKTGLMKDLLHPVSFFMERKMLITLKELAEQP